MPCTPPSPSSRVTTVTPDGKRPRAARKASGSTGMGPPRTGGRWARRTTPRPARVRSAQRRTPSGHSIGCPTVPCASYARRMRVAPASSASAAAGRPVVDPAAPPLARLWRYAAERRYRGRALGAAALSILNKLFDLAPPFLIGVGRRRRRRPRDLDARAAGRRHRSGGAARGCSPRSPSPSGRSSAPRSTPSRCCGATWRRTCSTTCGSRPTTTCSTSTWPASRSATRRGLMSVLNDDVNQLERFLDVGANEILQLATTIVVLGAFFFAIAPEVAWWALPADAGDRLGIAPLPGRAWRRATRRCASRSGC